MVRFPRIGIHITAPWRWLLPASLALFVSCSAWAYTSVNIEGGTSYFGVSSNYASTTISSNSTSSQFYHFNAEIALSDPREFLQTRNSGFVSLGAFGQFRQLSLALPSDAQGVSPYLALFDRGISLNLYTGRWAIKLAGAYEDTPIFYSPSAGNYSLNHYLLQTGHLKLEKIILTEGRGNLLLRSDFYYGADAPGAASEISLLKNYGAAIRLTYFHAGAFGWGLFAEYAQSQTEGPQLKQNSVEIRAGLELTPNRRSVKAAGPY